MDPENFKAVAIIAMIFAAAGTLCAALALTNHLATRNQKNEVTDPRLDRFEPCLPVPYGVRDEVPLSLSRDARPYNPPPSHQRQPVHQVHSVR